MKSKLIDKCNLINSRFDLMKEESSFVSGEASYSFLSSNRPLKCHLAPYSKYSSGKLSNETGN